MKRIFILLFVVVGLVYAQTNRYDVKSAIVEYEISGGGSVMGGEATLSGVSSLYFKNFGDIEYQMEKSIQKIMGETEEVYNVSKLVGDKAYTVDFDEKIIYEQKLIIDDELLNVKNEKNLISMGATKIGKEKILGYDCDVWELGEEKISIYKSVPLKIESSSMGVTQVQKATSAKFDVEVSDKKIKLPDFPVKKVEEIMMDEQMEAPELSPEQEKMMKELMDQIGKNQKEE